MRFFAIFALLVVEAKKKKIEYPAISSHKRPNDIKEELYCEGCLGVVDQSLKALYGSTRESDIFNMLETICNVDNYSGYRFPPPYMSDTCDQLIQDWD